METWKCENMEIRKSRKMEIWNYGNMELWKQGNMEIWKQGNMEIWKQGNRENYKAYVTESSRQLEIFNLWNFKRYQGISSDFMGFLGITRYSNGF